tara:strand:- start:59 stop:505 length:447 start_codon:yes stop_codon:yes gene_type:complete
MKNLQQIFKIYLKYILLINMENNDIKIINIKDKNIELLKTMLNIIDIEFEELDDLVNTIIVRDFLLKEDIEDKFIALQNNIKEVGYSSSKLTSLHKNSVYSQKFPAINMLRQILKCNGLKLLPKKEYNGYTAMGHKIINRYFIIVYLD